MKFVIQFSKNARYVTDSIHKLTEKDANRFKVLFAMGGKVLKLGSKEYKILNDC